MYYITHIILTVFIILRTKVASKFYVYIAVTSILQT